MAEQLQLVTLGELDLPHLGHIHPTLFCLMGTQVHILGGTVLDHVSGVYKYPPQFGHVGFAILDIVNYFLLLSHGLHKEPLPLALLLSFTNCSSGLLSLQIEQIPNPSLKIVLSFLILSDNSIN